MLRYLRHERLKLLLRRHMTNSFLSHGKGWDFGVTNVNLLALSGASLAYGFQSRGPFLSTTRKTTFLKTTHNSTTRNTPVKFYLLLQQLFQMWNLALAPDCRRPRQQASELEPNRRGHRAETIISQFLPA
jgi:hypothetical protein